MRAVFPEFTGECGNNTTICIAVRYKLPAFRLKIIFGTILTSR